MTQRSFTPASRHKAYRFAPMVAEDGVTVARLQAVIERQAAQISRLEYLATCDRVTGALNWLGLERELKTMLLDHERHGSGGALVVLDLNGFKAVNDTYGHEAGDVVLRHVAALLKHHVRADDVVARLGGDAFVVLMPRDGIGGPEAMGQMLARVIADLPCRYRGTNIWLTASVGGARVGEARDVKSLLGLAESRVLAAPARAEQI